MQRLSPTKVTDVQYGSRIGGDLDGVAKALRISPEEGNSLLTKAVSLKMATQKAN